MRFKVGDRVRRVEAGVIWDDRCSELGLPDRGVYIVTGCPNNFAVNLRGIRGNWQTSKFRLDFPEVIKVEDFL